MQIRVQNQDDVNTYVEVIDPSDGALTHMADLDLGEQIVVTATSARSPADIEFGEVEAIPSEEPEAAADESERVPEQKQRVSEEADEVTNTLEEREEAAAEQDDSDQDAA